MFNFIRITVLLTATVALAACTTPAKFTSAPAGAEVVYLDKVIGVTPFEYGVQDQFGWYSVYEFKANLAGYKEQVLKFYEKSIPDHNNVVPTTIHFELPPR